MASQAIPRLASVASLVYTNDDVDIFQLVPNGIVHNAELAR